MPRPPRTDEPPATEGFWDLLEPGKREVLLKVGQHHAHPAGSVLLREGERAESVFVLLRGRVKILAEGRSGHPALLAIRTAGDVLGELAAVDERLRSATVVAVDAIEVLRIPLTSFVSILQNDAGISYALLRTITTKLRSANVRRVETGDTTIGQRVGVALSELAAVHGVMAAGEITISVPLSQDDLAMMVGASREAIVRTLRQLRNQGIVRTGRRQIVLLRPELLAER